MIAATSQKAFYVDSTTGFHERLTRLIRPKMRAGPAILRVQKRLPAIGDPTPPHRSTDTDKRWIECGFLLD